MSTAAIYKFMLDERFAVREVLRLGIVIKPSVFVDIAALKRTTLGFYTYSFTKNF
jgi:hypothetical protein